VACIYYTASSLDGFIVDENAGLDWLISRDIDAAGPFGIDPFLDTVGALVMGSTTYEWIRDNQPGEWMYPQPSWVMTRRPEIIADGHPVQTFAGAVTDLYPTLAAAAGVKNVWVVGGGDVAAQFVAAGLVDEMVVSYAPCSLGAGSPVLPLRSEWTLAESAVNADFVCVRWQRA
jgi:dihydrofolate reductase